MWHYQRKNKIPVTDPKEIEICKLPDKEFKIIVLKNLNELQEKTTKQTHRNNTWRKWEVRHRETIKTSQKEILGLKNKMTALKNSTALPAYSIKQKKESVSMKTSQLKLPNQRKEKEKKKMEKRAKSLEELGDTIKRNNTHINGSPRRNR